VTDRIDFLSAIEEGEFAVWQAMRSWVPTASSRTSWCRAGFQNEFTLMQRERINYMDVSPKQIVSVAASLIPFLEHDDANRALMGSNNATSGCSRRCVRKCRWSYWHGASGRDRIRALPCGQACGAVDSVDASRIVVRVNDNETTAGEPGVDIYNLTKYTRSNQNTCINQRRVNAGDVIAPVSAGGRSSTHLGELALGQNCLSRSAWNGYNFEDSHHDLERVVQEDRFTTIHIES